MGNFANFLAVLVKHEGASLPVPLGSLPEVVALKVGRRMGALLPNELMEDIGDRGRGCSCGSVIHGLGLDQAPLNMAFVLVVIAVVLGPNFRLHRFDLGYLLGVPLRLDALQWYRARTLLVL